jgi:hypothetical protein
MRQLILIVCLFISFSVVKAQSQSSASNFSANATQGLIFGTFFRGNTGGTVIINPDGTRSVTGDIVQSTLGVPFSPAIFEISAKRGTVITILRGPIFKLNGNNGGTASLKIGSSIPASPFVVTAKNNDHTTIMIGATLTVSGPLTSPSGSYNGHFYVTFVQQ